MWLRTYTTPKWYVHEIRGVCYVSWVSDEDKANAQLFSENNVKQWADILSEMTGFDLEIVKPFV